MLASLALTPIAAQRQRSWLAEALRIRPGEFRVVLVLFAWCFCVVGAFFVGRAVRDTLFLARLSADKLPYVYIASPLVVTAVGLVYARIADRVRRDRLVVWTNIAFAVLLFGARFALSTGDWIYYALYILVQVIGAMAMMQFWTVASDRYTSGDAKRLFGVIAAGGTVADIVIGAVISMVGGSAGAENLLFLCGALLLASAGLAIVLRQLCGGRLETAKSRPAPSSRASRPRELPKGARHLPWTAVLIVLSIIGVTIVDFEFKTVLASTYGDSPGDMVRFFGYLSIATGIVSLLVQLFVTGRILGRFGIAGALVLLPLFLAAGQAVLLVVPGLIAATFLKGSEETFRYTVDDAAMQLTYMPVPKQMRGRFKALLGVVLKPGAQLVVGLGLLAYGRWSTELVPTVIVGLVVSLVWIGAVAFLRRAYIQSVRDTLRGLSALEPWEATSNPEEIQALRRVLNAANTSHEDLRTAIGVAAAIPELVPELTRLAKHSEPDIRAAVCTSLTTLGCEEVAQDLTEDPDPKVRAIAVACSPSGQGLTLERMINDSDPAIRLAAAVGLRFAGAKADPNAIITLLADTAAEVQSSALAAAESSGSPALVPSLVQHLRRVPSLAVPALTVCGRDCEEDLQRALEGATEADFGSREFRRSLLRTLGRIATPKASAILIDALPHDRITAALALAEVMQREPSMVLDRSQIMEACNRELLTAYRGLAAAEGLGRAETRLETDGTYAPPPFLRHVADGSAALISTTLRERTDDARDCAMALIAAMFPEADLRTAAQNLREPDPARRAHAVELLEHVLDRDLRARVIPLVDGSPRYDKLKAVASIYTMPQHSPAEWIDELLADNHPWMVACALYFAGMHGMTHTLDRCRDLSEHTDPVVRESAFVAVTRLGDTDCVRAVAQRLANDSFAPLRRRASEFIAATGGALP